ncbi:MAG: hypothetical protein H0V92_05120 [Pseudonocardiales bacterium]|nr:hypothetical protein [Pseudonocardiales bacterium]
MAERPRVGKSRAAGNIETLRSGALWVRVYAEAVAGPQGSARAAGGKEAVRGA